MASNVNFYHYTNSKHKDEIIESGVINETKKAAHKHFGEGTYGTAMEPSAGKAEIAKNNWTNHGKAKMEQGDADWAIKVEIPADKVSHHGGDRDILKHDGPIDLNKYKGEAVPVTKP